MAIIPTPVAPLSDPPDTNDPTNFDLRGDTFFQELKDDFQPGMEQLASDAYANTLLCEAAAAGMIATTALAATSTTSLTIGENTSKGPITFAESAREFQKGQWVNVAYTSDPTQAMTGRITAVDNTAKTMTIFVPVGGSDGSGSYSSWVISLGGKMGVDGDVVAQLSVVNPQSGAYTLAATDLGDVVEYTGTGGHTWAGDIGVVGASFNTTILHGGSGVLKLNFSQNIDGKDEIWVYPGESFRVATSATLWKTIGRRKTGILASATATASQTAAAIEGVFSDPELVSLSLRLPFIKHASASTLCAQLKFNGSYVTSTYTSDADATATGGSSEIRLTVTSATRLSGEIRMPNPLSNVAYANTLQANLYASGSTASSDAQGANSSAQTGACQGVKFYPLSVSFDADSDPIYAYINRE